MLAGDGLRWRLGQHSDGCPQHSGEGGKPNKSTKLNTSCFSWGRIRFADLNDDGAMDIIVLLSATDGTSSVGVLLANP